MSAQPARKYDFEVGVYRPPSEGGSASLLLRLTRNCPWNRTVMVGPHRVFLLQ
jgi:hypothetical protein